MREQSLHFGLKPASKYMSCVVGPIRQIRIGVTRFPVNPELKLWRSMQIKYLNIEVEKIDSAMLMLV